MTVRSRRVSSCSRALLLITAVYLALWMCGCAHPAVGPSPATGISSAQQARAQEQYQALRAAAAAGDDAQVQRLATDYLARFSGSPQEAEVQWLLATAAHRMGDDKTAAHAARTLVTRHPTAPSAGAAQRLLAELGGAAEPSATPPMPGEQIAEGTEQQGAVQVGLLCPLSGEYAVIGQDMQQAARMAVDDFNTMHQGQVGLSSRDTGGDGVKSVLAARELIDQQNAVALVGALLSPTTIAVGTLCEERQVPLVSPTATQATIADLGRFVFQTNLTPALESHLLAFAAVQRLLRRRFAVLFPQDDEGRAYADRFQAEVEALGGRVVAREGFDKNATDFREAIQRLRAAAPEVLFLPCAPSQVRLIAPQLPYYQFDVQLLGLGSWNAPALVGEVGTELDMAVFPDENALMGQDRRDRLDQLWQGAHGSGQHPSPFALKAYFAMNLVLDGIAAQAQTREAMREFLATELPRRAQGAGGDPLTALRVIEDGAIVAFPAGAFPAQQSLNSRTQ